MIRKPIQNLNDESCGKYRKGNNAQRELNCRTVSRSSAVAGYAGGVNVGTKGQKKEPGVSARPSLSCPGKNEGSLTSGAHALLAAAGPPTGRGPGDLHYGSVTLALNTKRSSQCELMQVRVSESGLEAPWVSQ